MAIQRVAMLAVRRNVGRMSGGFNVSQVLGMQRTL